MLLSKNRKALFDHELLKKYTAGIVLRGYEVKAIKEGKAAFEGSFVKVIQNKPVLENLFIGRYSKQSKDFGEMDAARTRELLLNKKEIDEIQKEISQKGKTAVPLALILENGKIKLELAVVKGRKDFEVKRVAKDRQIKKDLERESKEIKRFFWQ